MLVLAFLLALLAADPSADPTAIIARRAPPPAPAGFGSSWDAFVGDWKGSGSGTPGQGSGTTSFQYELGRRIFVRRGVSDYPATADKPAVHHEDLLIVQAPRPNGEASAMFYDSEGHVIQYVATWSADGKAVTFATVEGAPGPQFRLTHSLTAPDTMTVTFEVAPPGTKEYKTYVNGTVKRVSAH